jgi:hypothetical protein
MFDLKITEADGCIVARISGDWNEKELQKSIEQIAAEAGRVQCDRVLIDLCRLSEPESGYDRFVIGEYIAQIWGPPLNLRVAAVAKGEAINKFAEDTAVNRGADFLVTDDMYKAISWLKER